MLKSKMVGLGNNKLIYPGNVERGDKGLHKAI
jgi:hypothetical protein